MKKTLLATALVLASGVVQASPFYVDPGTNFDGDLSPVAGKVCDTCTSVKEEFTVRYESETTIVDNDANGIDAGDFVFTDVGLALPGATLGFNSITGFTPGESFGTNSDNGYGGANWLLSFSISGLAGVVTGIDGVTNLPELAYGPGLLELFITFDGSTFNNFMDISILGGTTTGLGTFLIGEADFTNVDAGFNNLFHSADKSCLGSDGFFDIWSNCGNDVLPINFTTHFDTDPQLVQVSGTSPLFTINGRHDGSATFEVPEPGTLGLLGLGLLGFGLVRRRKA